MLALVKKIASFFLIFSIGTVFGPLLVAALITAFLVSAEPDPYEVRSEAQKLVGAYFESEKDVLYLSRRVMPQDGAECGYDPQQLFPEDQLQERLLEKRFTPYFGYLLLDNWRSDIEQEVYKENLVEALESNESQFELGFLRRCVSWTLARNFCMKQFKQKVRAYSSRPLRDNHPTDQHQILGYGNPDDVVCLYADGVAAKIGIPRTEEVN